MSFKSQWPCECGAYECAVRMGGNTCTKCRKIRGQGRTPIRAVPTVDLVDTRKRNDTSCERINIKDKEEGSHGV